MSYRLFLTQGLLAIASVAMANNYSVRTIPSLIAPGENFLLLVNLENTEQTQVSGWDFKMVLPEGVTFEKARGTANFGTISDTPEVLDEAFSTNIVKDSKEANTYYVYSFSAGKTNSESNTTLVSFSLKSDAAITAESLKGLLKLCTIADNNAKSYSLNDVAFTLNFGKSTTGVKEIEELKNENDETIFNLNGQRVNKSTNGIYVKAGKRWSRNKSTFPRKNTRMQIS